MDSTQTFPSHFEKLAAATFLFVALLLAFDIADDIAHGADLSHVLSELFVFLAAVSMIVGYLWSVWAAVKLRHQTVLSSLQRISNERDTWRARSTEYLQGLARAIDEQFDAWKLSESEKEVALLILKGLSHKEIAGVRSTSERTVRQQAAAVYTKAKVENKAQLSAFFLEDLMLPVRRDGATNVVSDEVSARTFD